MNPLAIPIVKYVGISEMMLFANPGRAGQRQIEEGKEIC